MRLSRLQKMILTVLLEKDKIDKEGWYKDKNVEPPYWHSTRDRYTTLLDGEVIPRITERGVVNTVKLAGKFREGSFPASFSRSIKNLEAKGLIERLIYPNGGKSNLIKVKTHQPKLNNKEGSTT